MGNRLVVHTRALRDILIALRHTQLSLRTHSPTRGGRSGEYDRELIWAGGRKVVSEGTVLGLRGKAGCNPYVQHIAEVLRERESG